MPDADLVDTDTEDLRVRAKNLLEDATGLMGQLTDVLDDLRSEFADDDDDG